MKYQYKIYTALFIGFVFLLASLIYSYNNIQANAKVLKYLDKDQIKLSYFTNKINYDIKDNQAEILQYIALKKNISGFQTKPYLENIKKSIAHLKKFQKTHTELPLQFSTLLETIEKRVIAYSIVENSLIKAIQSKNEEDIQDALLGFDSITVKFSSDTQMLIDLANVKLYEKIYALEQNNKTNANILTFIFLMALLLIGFAIYKFVQLHNNIKSQLKRTQEAEEELQLAQDMLLEYNEDLEKEITKKEKELVKKIYTNPISSLPNRNKLLEDATKYKFTRMALLNIDKFQSFNDVYGENIGNIALQFTGEFLQKMVKNLDVKLYHIGGDEFVIVCINSTNEDNQLFIESIEKILKAYREKKFTYQNKTFQFMISCGITFTGRNKMLAYADMALKDAKKRNIQLSIFHEDKSLEKKYKNDLECHKKLKRAIETNNILSYFQPIVPIQDTSETIKYESLVRLKDADGTIIPPFNFLNVAKANRIYYKITRIILQNTLETIAKYQIPCSINLSLSDIENKRTMEYFFNTLENYQYNELLSVELLETEDFNNYDLVNEFCLKVRSYGIKISLDDFGSGYANFSHILNLPVDFIKIDASLISNIDRNQNSKIMVETIVTLAKKLKVQTIAEFVSSESILNVVKELGVDYAQGFHVGKPLSIEEYIKD